LPVSALSRRKQGFETLRGANSFASDFEFPNFSPISRVGGFFLADPAVGFPPRGAPQGE
jgi:hypothetical protein